MSFISTFDSEMIAGYGRIRITKRFVKDRVLGLDSIRTTQHKMKCLSLIRSNLIQLNLGVTLVISCTVLANSRISREELDLLQAFKEPI